MIDVSSLPRNRNNGGGVLVTNVWSSLSPDDARLAESAIHSGNIDAFRKMINNKPKLLTGRVGVKTLLHLAAFYGQTDIVRLLIENGVDVNVLDGMGQTALHDSTSSTNSVAAARVLLEMGANVNMVNHNGETPLHRAVITSSIEMVRLLIEHGANVDVRDNMERTPIEMAIIMNNADAVRDINTNTEGVGLNVAIADYTKAIKHGASYYEFNYRGYAKQIQGDLTGAISDYNISIDIEPKNPEAYINRGFVEQTLGNWDGAMMDYNKALGIQPWRAEAQNRLKALMDITTLSASKCRVL